MTNSIALGLGLLLLGGLAVDLYLFGDGHLVFVAKKLFELTEWMAFWR
jgi:hypothetical protein